MYQLKISAAAQEEFEESVLWYKAQSEKDTAGFSAALKNAFVPVECPEGHTAETP